MYCNIPIPTYSLHVCVGTLIQGLPVSSMLPWLHLTCCKSQGINRTKHTVEIYISNKMGILAWERKGAVVHR